MQNEIQPKIYLIADENDTSKVYDISSRTRIYLDIQDISQIWNMSRKRLDLYLFRHKEIPIFRHGKKKLIQIQILQYLFKNIQKELKKK